MARAGNRSGRRGSRALDKAGLESAPAGSFTLAIVGRPNVGKSTLFNRLVGKRLAIVDDTPGVTRDRREGEGQLGDLIFRVIDTAGYEDAHDQSLEARMREQTERAIREADLCLMMIDARAGVVPLDERFAEVLRRAGGPVALAANKCEGTAAEAGLMEAYSLGLGDPLPLSAEHGEGISDLYDLIAEGIAAKRSADAAARSGGVREGTLEAVEPGSAPTAILPEGAAIEEEGEQVGDDTDEVFAVPEEADRLAEEVAAAEDALRAKPMQLAIVGRPNVGKSTLVNKLIGEDRLLTGPEAGITRDSIALDWAWREADGDRPLKLIDTAGLRKKARVTDKVEKLSALDTRRSIDFAHVVVLLLDANDMLEKQDLTIARQVLEEGRALVIAANKWDTIADKKAAMQKLRDRFEISLPQARGARIVTISAKTGRNLDQLIQAAFDVYDTWNRRIPTSALNRWLADRTATHPPPLAKGRRIKLRYMTQARIRPPTFALFASQAAELPDSYQRYLVNGLREDFGLNGVPLRLGVRQGKNPFAPKR
ncbi:ribosome biogenesis GTPase Der [Marivibrio halodurans]|uniref:GTPase Der n=1 Tax=Marivibrio halodurans TaxID=2039722 RepID=A0A8J7RYP7_9PROT|nr:ribosome biogenesis GTPase Der [Marivibrio halodurans]MBP5856810.1 ribosome biogenesis GTPase Der [Marivibrio halodurans]